MIGIDDFLMFSDRTLEGMRQAIAGLTHEEINWLPPLPDPNSAYQLVIHSTSAAQWWTSHVVLGGPADRDRDAEFVSSGSTAEAVEAIDRLQRHLHEVGPQLAATHHLAVEIRRDNPSTEPWTVGAAMIHVYEELAQHLGHIEITVDLARRG